MPCSTTVGEPVRIIPPRRPHRTFSARHLWMPVFAGMTTIERLGSDRPPVFGVQPRLMSAASDRATGGAGGQIELHVYLACLPHRGVRENIT
jgi:hypothetical protein